MIGERELRLMPKNAVLSAEGAGTMDIGLTQLHSTQARSVLNAGTYGTMGVGLGQAIAAHIANPGRPVIHLETLTAHVYPSSLVARLMAFAVSLSPTKA